jgi:hypothetical protein
MSFHELGELYVCDFWVEISFVGDKHNLDVLIRVHILHELLLPLQRFLQCLPIAYITNQHRGNGVSAIDTSHSRRHSILPCDIPELEGDAVVSNLNDLGPELSSHSGLVVRIEGVRHCPVDEGSLACVHFSYHKDLFHFT